MSAFDNSISSQNLSRVDGAQLVSVGARRLDPSAADLQATESHVPAPEFLQALQQLKQIPTVRSDVVQQVSAKLNSGALQTPAAAQETALAILGGHNLSVAEPLFPLFQFAAASEEPTRNQATELPRLLDTLRQIPVLRQEVISEVAQRLTAGQYSTPAAVDDTVKAISATVGRNG